MPGVSEGEPFTEHLTTSRSRPEWMADGVGLGIHLHYCPRGPGTIDALPATGSWAGLGPEEPDVPVLFGGVMTLQPDGDTAFRTRPGFAPLVLGIPNSSRPALNFFFSLSCL